jgi:hypothetical protein
MSRRGGRAQKRNAVAMETEEAERAGRGPMTDESHSPLWLALMNKWAWGTLSAPAVQELAQAAVFSGCDRPDVKELADLGARGEQAGNIHRDLLRLYVKGTASPTAYVAQVPMHVRDDVSGEMTIETLECHMLLPHDWMASLDSADCGREAYGVDGLREFWQNANPQDPRFVGNPFTSVRDKSKFVPWLVHGDAAQFQARDSLLIISMRSLLTRQPVMKSQFMLAALPKKCRSTSDDENQDSWAIIWKHLAWSFAAMYEGKHPLIDAYGHEFPPGSERAALAGKALCPNTGLKGIVWVLAGDYDYLCNELGLQHPMANEPCSYCNCNVTDRPWNDFRPQAAWRSGSRTAEENRASCPSKHPLMSIPGVVFETIRLDSMHLLELGVTQHVLANVLADIVYDHLPGTKDANAKIMNAAITELYRDLGITSDRRVPELLPQNFCAKRTEYPCLKAVKAREARYLTPVVQKLAERYVSDDVYSKQRLACVSKLSEMYEIIDAHLLYTPAAALKALEASTLHFLLHYSWLAKNSMQRNLNRWNVIPKHHYLVHLAQQAAYQSPRACWAYGGESTVGTIAALGQACSAGTSSAKLSKPLMAKYCIAMHLLLSGMLSSDASSD